LERENRDLEQGAVAREQQFEANKAELTRRFEDQIGKLQVDLDNSEQQVKIALLH
jgi:hypothetical protein